MSDYREILHGLRVSSQLRYQLEMKLLDPVLPQLLTEMITAFPVNYQ